MKIPLILIFTSTLILSSCTQDNTVVNPILSDSGVTTIMSTTASTVGGTVNTGTSDSFSGTIRSPK